MIPETMKSNLKTTGFALLAVGFLFLVWINLGNAFVTKAVVSSHCAAIGRSTTYTDDQVRQELIAVGLHLQQKLRIMLLPPAGALLAGCLCLLASRKSSTAGAPPLQRVRHRPPHSEH
jgi:lipopolysaccharide export LptBFGC system permease protein LptF